MTEPSSDSWTSQSGTELARYIAIARRWWWLFVAGAAIAGLTAYFVTLMIAPTYKATASLLINQAQEPGAIVYNDILTSERLTKTYRELITKDPILEAVVALRGVEDLTVDELQTKLDVKVVRDTQLVEISAKDENPDRAALLANAVAGTFVEQESQALSRPGISSVVEVARAPRSPVSPNMSLNVALAAVVGFLLAGGLALLLEYLDDTLKSPDDVAEGCGLPTLGEVSRWRTQEGDIRVVARASHGPEAEAYTMVRTNIQFSTIAKPAHTVLVTSANPGEGKSTTAANYALAVADTGKTVALVDSDLRRPSLHRAFGLDNSSGLSTALLQQTSLDDGVLRQTSHDRLRLLTSGPLPPNPAELLDWQGFDEMLEWLKGTVDLVVFDSPPIHAVADARILAAKVDATVLVVDSGTTRAKSVNEARQALARVNANVLGVVLNKVKRGRRSYYYYYYSGNGRRPKGRRRAEQRDTRPAQTTEAVSVARSGSTASPPGSNRPHGRDNPAGGRLPKVSPRSDQPHGSPEGSGSSVQEGEGR